MKREKDIKTSEGVSLVKIHPISKLYAIRKTFWLCAPLLISLLLIRWIPLVASSLPTRSPMIGVARDSLISIALVLCIGCVGGMIYYSLRRRSYFYGIEEGQLIIGRGIIIRERGFFQLSRITEVYLDRSFIDVLFGLYTLRISTPTAVSDKFARIDGLNEETALALQHHLSLILEENYGGEIKDTRFPVLRFARGQELPTPEEYAMAANAA